MNGEHEQGELDRIAAILGMSMGGERKRLEFKPITEADTEKGFQPIPDLKPGDKVRAKSEQYCIDSPFRNGAIATVHRVEAFKSYENGSLVSENDFTSLFDDGTNEGSIVEFAFDSRRFERVE